MDTQKIDKRALGSFIVFGALIILLLCLDTKAFEYQQVTKDAYDFEVIESALVEAYVNNDSYDLMDFDVSDGEGLTSITLGEGNYTMRTSKPGFNENERVIYINESEERITYLTFVSESIVKVEYTDLTLTGGRGICLYFANTHRLKDCYFPNETIMLTEGNYSLYLKQNLIDSAGTSISMLTIIMQLLPFLIILLVLCGLFVFGIGAVYYITKKVVQ